MLLSRFDYVLPKELIAKNPLPRRDASRMLVVDRRRRKVIHGAFCDLVEYLSTPDIMILNNTKVMPVRLLGHKKGTLGKVDVLLVRRISGRKFEVYTRPSLKIGQEIIFDKGNISASLMGDKILEFDVPLSEKKLNRFGFMPLPPYIKRQPLESDRKRYQAVYAKNPGAIAAPTAGLHFTKSFISKIKNKRVSIDYVTLHVGPATFKPVRCMDVRNHKMENEDLIIQAKTLQAIANSKEKGGKVFAVGTTTTRTLESVAPLIHREEANKIVPKVYKAATNLFIYPGYEFKVIDCLLTNFHLPKTTLFMLVCAFAGEDLIKQAYQEAIDRKYRFYSYGDAMLII